MCMLHVKATHNFTIYMYMYAYYCISDPKVLGPFCMLYATLVWFL